MDFGIGMCILSGKGSEMDSGGCLGVYLAILKRVYLGVLYILRALSELLNSEQ